jgi:zinc protease
MRGGRVDRWTGGRVDRWTGGRVDRWTGGRARLGVLALVLAGPAAAQQIDRSVRPSVPTAAPFRFPAIRTHTLSNGIRVFVVEDHSIPVVAVRAIVAGDSLLDPPGKEGLFAVTLGALREGSTKRSADDLALAATAIGTNVNPTGFTTIPSAFEPALDLMSEMLTRPALDSASIERRKATQAAAARRVAQAPVTVPRHLFYRLVYGADDPFVHSLIPTETTIGSITRVDVSRFYDMFFSPRTTTVAVVGDVTDSVVMAAVSKSFGAWLPRGEPPDIERLGLIGAGPGIYLHDVPGAGTQAYLYVGRTGPSRRGPDVVAAEAYGALASARLQETLREKRSFMYSGAVGLTWRHGDATFVGSTVVSAQKVDSALAEWLRILRELRTTNPPTVQEVEGVRRSRVGALASRIDGPDSVATRLLEFVRDGQPLDYYERYADTMSALTVPDVVAAGARYADPDQLVIVVTGDRRVLEPALRAAKLAPVVVVDASGRPLP